MRLGQISVLAAGVFALAACASREDPQEAVVTKPILVIGTSHGFKPAPDDPSIWQTDEATYDVRLELDDVLAGAPEHSMAGEVLTVRLNSGNEGLLKPGREILVLIDPRLIGKPVGQYWRLWTRFACIEKAAVDSSGLSMAGKEKMEYGADVCIPYGP